MPLRLTIQLLKRAVLPVLTGLVFSGSITMSAQADGTAQDETFDIFQSRMNQQTVTRSAPPVLAPPPVATAPMMQSAPQQQAAPAPMQQSRMPEPMPRPVGAKSMEPMAPAEQMSPAIYDPYDDGGDFLALDPVWAAVGTGLLVVLGLVLVL